MYYQEFLPPPSLRPFIRHYFHHTMDMILERGYTDIIVPNLAAGLTICYQLKENIKLSHRQTSYLKVDLPRSNILPPLTQRSLFFTQGGFWMIGVVFQPGALFKIFKVPLSEFTNKVLDTESTLGPEMRELEERVVEARDLRERLEAVNQYFLWKLSKADPKSGYIDAVFRWLPKQGPLQVKDLGHYMNVTYPSDQPHLLGLMALA